MDVTRYPLAWPTGWKRTPKGQIKHAHFNTKRPGEFRKWMTIASAIDRLRPELRRLGVPEGAALLSTNVRVRLDGLPVSNAIEPDDRGVALYFQLAGQDRVLACDQWSAVADNIAAIAAHINAIRAIDRYGVGTLDQAFAGYVGLPAKGATWRTTLGFASDQVVTPAEIQHAFRERAKAAHPDMDGGSHDAMASLTAAKTEGLAEVR